MFTKLGLFYCFANVHCCQVVMEVIEEPLLTVPVELSFWWIMLYPALRVVLLPSVTMKSGTLQLVC